MNDPSLSRSRQSLDTFLGVESIKERPRWVKVSVIAAVVVLLGALLAYCFGGRSEEHTSELQSLMRISYAVFCLTKKNCHSSMSVITTPASTSHITTRTDVSNYHTPNINVIETSNTEKTTTC